MRRRAAAMNTARSSISLLERCGSVVAVDPARRLGVERGRESVRGVAAGSVTVAIHRAAEARELSARRADEVLDAAVCHR